MERKNIFELHKGAETRQHQMRKNCLSNTCSPGFKERFKMSGCAYYKGSRKERDNLSGRTKGKDAYSEHTHGKKEVPDHLSGLTKGKDA